MNIRDAGNDSPPTRRRHWARRTHRVLGVSSLLFLVLMSGTGLLLNHADDLGLSHTAARPWLLNLYGVELPPVEAAFAAGGATFATSADTLYANGQPLAQSVRQLIGAVALQPVLVVATDNEFFLTNEDAALIERYVPDVSQPMRQLGTDGNRIIVAFANSYAEFDPEQMSVSVAENIAPDTVAWSQPTMPDAEQAQQIGVAALGQAINWERVLLDLHSGRILPGLGRYLADLTALALLYMCFSGIVLWTRRR